MQKFPYERGGDCAKNGMKSKVTKKRIGPPLLESRWKEGGKWKSFCMPINVIVGFREVMQKQLVNPTATEQTCVAIISFSFGELSGSQAGTCRQVSDRIDC